MATILLVDDDEDLRDSLRPVLEAEGHRIVDVSDGAEAMQCWRSLTLSVNGCVWSHTRYIRAQRGRQGLFLPKLNLYLCFRGPSGALTAHSASAGEESVYR